MLAHSTADNQVPTSRPKRAAHANATQHAVRAVTEVSESNVGSSVGEGSSKRTKTANGVGKKATRRARVARHPLGIRPLGNAFLSERNDRSATLGLLSLFDDEFLLNFVSSLADDPHTLACLEAVSHGLYVLVNATNSVWRDAFLTKFDGRMVNWCGSWKRTFMWHCKMQLPAQVEPVTCSLPAAMPRPQTPHLFSDILYHPFRLSMAPLQHLVAPACTFKPIAKLDMAASGSVLKFKDRYARTNVPVILQNSMDNWPCRGWNMDRLIQLWPDRYFQCEAVKARLPTYLEYSRGMQRLTSNSDDDDDDDGHSNVAKVSASFDGFSIPDESPFYLFDAAFADDPQAAKSWRVPYVFEQIWQTEAASSPDTPAVKADLLSLLGPRRPDHRWIIAGPSRSGSGWHKDPNGTSAWNAVLTGRKAWMMLPPHVTPPGVYVSEDEAEVTAPLSIAEWLLDFAEETRRLHGPKAKHASDRVLLEGVCEAGEVLYVPSGWWHLVINLEESVALTQNFVSPAELGTVLDFMKNKADQLSGFKKGKVGSAPTEDVSRPDCQQQNSLAEHEEDEECEDGADFGVFDLFCARLAEFDERLLVEGLNRVAQIESSRLGSTQAAHSVQQRTRSSGHTRTGTWWEQLRKRPDSFIPDSVGSQDIVPTASFSFSGQLAEDELDDVPW